MQTESFHPLQYVSNHLAGFHEASPPAFIYPYFLFSVILGSITGIGSLSPLLGVEIVHFIVRSDCLKLVSYFMMEGKL
jgi:hypothetical protein